MISAKIFLPLAGGLVTTKLLAVDDSKTLRKVLEITFAGEDFQTDLAASAEEALQKVRASRPAVAVLDTALGGSSGYDLCQELKAQAPELMVVLLSSKHRPYDQTRGAQVGADDYIDKPFDTQKLLDKVSSLLARGTASARAVAEAPAARPAPAVVSAAPRPAVASAAPQRPAASTPARPAPAPSIGARPVAPAPTFGTATAPRPVASAAPAPAPAATPAQASAAPASPPEAAAQPRVAAAVAAAGADLSTQLQGLGLDANQVQGVLALSREVVERVVWEVVPVLAETLIKEEIARLTAE